MALTVVPATEPETSLPPALSPTDDMTRALLNNGREVSEERRQSLTAHLAELNRKLGGCRESDVIKHVAVLRLAMAKAGTSHGQEEQVLMTYAMVLSELPLWAITRACKDFLHGRVGDGRFAPTPAEIAARCRTLMARYVEDRAKIERALGVAKAPARQPWEDEL